MSLNIAPMYNVDIPLARDRPGKYDVVVGQAVVFDNLVEWTFQFKRNGEVLFDRKFQMGYYRREVFHVQNPKGKPPLRILVLDSRLGLRALSDLVTRSSDYAWGSHKDDLPNLIGMDLGPPSGGKYFLDASDNVLYYWGALGRQEQAGDGRIVGQKVYEDFLEFTVLYQNGKSKTYRIGKFIKAKDKYTKDGNPLLEIQDLSKFLSPVKRAPYWRASSNRLTRENLIVEIEKRLNVIDRIRRGPPDHLKTDILINDEQSLKTERLLAGLIFRLMKQQAGIELQPRSSSARIRGLEIGMRVMTEEQLDFYIKGLEDRYQQDGRLSPQEVRAYLYHAFNIKGFRLSNESLLQQAEDFIKQKKPGPMVRLLRTQVYLQLIPGISHSALLMAESGGHRMTQDTWEVLTNSLKAAYQKDGRLRPEDIERLMKLAFVYSSLVIPSKKKRLEQKAIKKEGLLSVRGLIHKDIDFEEKLDDGNEVEDRPQGEGPQRHAEQVLAAADQRKDGVQQAERVQSRGHTQPDDAHFSHGVESMLTVYRGVAQSPWGGPFLALR